MNPQKVGLLGLRRGEGLEIERRVIAQGVQHRAKALRPLGVAGARVVAGHGGVGIECEGHRRRLAPPGPRRKRRPDA